MCTVPPDLGDLGFVGGQRVQDGPVLGQRLGHRPGLGRPHTRALVVGADIDSSSEESTELPEQATIRRWNSGSLATSSSASGCGPMLSSQRHHHVWDLRARDQDRITGPEMAVLRRDLLLGDYRAAGGRARREAGAWWCRP